MENGGGGDGQRQVVRAQIPSLGPDEDDEEDGEGEGDGRYVDGVDFIAGLLGLTGSELNNACTMHTIKAANSGGGGGAGGGKAFGGAEANAARVDSSMKQAISVPLSAQQTMDSILALVKFAYSELFNWLVAKINEAHCTTEGAAATTAAAAASADGNGELKFIGILDSTYTSLFHFFVTHY